MLLNQVLSSKLQKLRKYLSAKMILIIQLIIISFLMPITNICAQEVRLSKQKTTIGDFFADLKKQTGYSFLWDNGLLDSDKKIELSNGGFSLEKALEQCLKGTELAFKIQNKIVYILKKSDSSEQITIKGRILDEQGKPVASAVVRLKGTERSTTTNSDGDFYMENVGQYNAVEISCVGYQSALLSAKKEMGYIVLKAKVNELDQVIVNAGYYSTTEKERTGSISTVTAKDIETQPIDNVLQALGGKVPGMTVAQTDGLPGGFFDVVIRGRNSLQEGYRPLILIDGVPFSNDKTAGAFPGAQLGNSPLAALNPSDIESIEVLKDADATAIYGSRGSNGIILITTKKGKAGPGSLNINAYTGITAATQNIQMLNTQQYLEMRKEAFKNDNITPTVTSAPDLLVWDQNKYTDWNKLYRQGTAKSSNIQMEYSGGDALSTYRIGLNYHHETPLNTDVAKKVTGHNLGYNKGGMQVGLTHHTKDGRLSFTLNTGYHFDNSAFTGLVGLITLPPNAPDPIDSSGNLVWQANGVSYQNPLADLYKTYNSQNKTMVSSLNITYKILHGFDFEVNGGYDFNQYKEVRNSPAIAFNPSSYQTSSSNFQNTEVSSWQIEPMLHYSSNIRSKSKIDLVGGTSWNTKKTE